MRQTGSLSSRAWRAIRAEVMSREDTCYLCGGPVDKSLPGSSLMGPQVDHVQARASGGAFYDSSNLHLVHALCNQRKSSMDLEVYRFKQVNGQQHSREW